jgi:deoxyribodipyrimidine photolyase-related protein
MELFSINGPSATLIPAPVSSAITLVYPHQLFDEHPAITIKRPVWLVEDELFFGQYAFHRQKLAFHRATMRTYEEQLKKNGCKTEYIHHHDKRANTEKLFETLSEHGIKEVHICDTTDYLLERRLHRYASAVGIQLIRYPNPNFLCDKDELKKYFDKKKRFFLTDFYIAERKRLNVLITKGEPVGGKWTFDTENRKKMPKGTKIPSLPKASSSIIMETSLREIASEFPSNPGELSTLHYPVNRDDAKRWLNDFVATRFQRYGDYQDAIVSGETFLFHSLLTPMLNVGLLDPATVIDTAVTAANKYQVPLNALEGFVRQVMGWREFVRAVYELRGVEQRKRNFWNHQRKMPASFYNGTTGIPPVDDAIKKTLQFGYTHHIERLMVLGNFMLLCEIDPDDIYRWFMELYIDAYDWVMVPNVYGMSQFADGGLMSTKPYISGSNYILKMSDHSKGDWCEVWDALYWRFVTAHRDFFLRNPRMSMMVRMAEKMDKNRFSDLMDRAELYLASLDNQQK